MKRLWLLSLVGILVVVAQTVVGAKPTNMQKACAGILRSNEKWIFVVDTDANSGGFNREIVAYMTGRIGACRVGERYAKLFYQEMEIGPQDIENIDLEQHQDLGNPFGFIIDELDNKGTLRPSYIYPTAGVANFRGNSFKLDDTHLPVLASANEWYPAYQSVAFSLSRPPKPEEMGTWKQRALAFQDLAAADTQVNMKPFKIVGFRLIFQPPPAVRTIEIFPQR